MASGIETSPALRITLKFAGNVGLVLLLNTFAPRTMTVLGGWPAYIVIGALLTLLNVFVRPIIDIVVAPFRLFATIPAIIAANVGIVWLIDHITKKMDATLITVLIGKGLVNWILLGILLGMGNWLMKEMLK